MSDIKNGGAAFPQGKAVGSVSLLEGGMTLRDYFAAKAMQAMAAAPMGKFTHSQFDELVESAYAMAYAMIKEREK